MTTLWETAARQFDPPTPRWATPGDLARTLNPGPCRPRRSTSSTPRSSTSPTTPTAG